MPLTLSGDHINDSGGTDQYCPIGESFEHHGYEKKEGIRCVYTAKDEKNRSKLGNNSDFQRRIMVLFLIIIWVIPATSRNTDSE